MFKKLFKKDKDKEKDNKDTKQPQAPQAPPTYDNAYDGRKVTRDEFESLDVLGKGSFAQVVLAKRTTTGQYYAMKVVTKEGLINHKRVNDVFVERNVLTRSNHPFLMKLYWTFQSEHRVYFVMDYMPGGDLESFIAKQPSNRLDMMTTRLYAAEIFLALTHIHKQKVIYRDLKPENILLSGDGHCVLSDFGLSKDLLERKERDAQRTYSFVGSTFYVAPEVLLGTKYGTAVDLWSFGVLLFRMIFGHPPFSGGSTTDVFHKIVNAEPAFPPNSTKFVSSSAIDLLQRLLIKDPAKRITEPEVKSHEFWCGIDWNDIYSKEMSAPMWVPPQGPGTRVRSKNSGVEPTPGHGTAAQAQAAVGTPQGASVLDAEEQSLFHGFSQRAFSCED